MHRGLCLKQRLHLSIRRNLNAGSSCQLSQWSHFQQCRSLPSRDRKQLSCFAVAQKHGRAAVSCQQRAVHSEPCTSTPSMHIATSPRDKNFASAVELKLLGFSGLASLSLGFLGSGYDLEGFGSTIQALAVLAAIVAVHESGHFFAARLQRIRVTKFAIGFGPSLFEYKGKDVEYSLRAIPLGGYVAFPDDDPESKIPPDDPDLLRNRPIYQRAAVISAGVIANILFAWTILFAQVSTVGLAETTILPGVVVPKVVSHSVAEAAGIRPGDLITQVDGLDIPPTSDSVSRVVSRIKAHPSDRMVFTVQRGGNTYEVPVLVDMGEDGGGRIGAQLSTHAQILHTKPQGLDGAVNMANSELRRLTSTVTYGLRRIFTNFTAMSSQISGPIAIISQGSEIARADAAGLFQFGAIVNVNLAVVNALPLPALDGGYMLLLAVEAIRRKKLPVRLEQGIMGGGLLLLTALGIGLVIRDTVNLL